jgi:predicted O-methyltransferase YrrM
MQETSIDWILQQLNKQNEIIAIQSQETQLDMIHDIFEQAKIIHKQELINACTLGYLAESSIEYQNIIKLLKK